MRRRPLPLSSRRSSGHSSPLSSGLSGLLSRRQALAALAGGAAAFAACAASFPARPITLVVPFAPGGIADLTARVVGLEMGRRLGQPLVVDNRPSAGSIVASQAVATARPDGHTLLLMSNSNALSASLFRRLPYDTLRDFTPVSTLGFFDLALFVAGPSRWQRLSELVAAARAWPGRLTVGTIAVGSTQHLAAELFKTLAGVDFLIVPYRGTPAMLRALRSGEIDLGFEILGPLLPQVSAGVVRALAVSADRRNPALPGVPTVQEAGVAGFSVASWNALAAPAGTPRDVIDQLNEAVREALASPGVRERLLPLGMRLSPSTPEEAASLLEQEVRRWAGVIRQAGIQPD